VILERIPSSILTHFYFVQSRNRADSTQTPYGSHKLIMITLEKVREVGRSHEKTDYRVKTKGHAHVAKLVAYARYYFYLHPITSAAGPLTLITLN
jgi:hypothetical protein